MTTPDSLSEAQVRQLMSPLNQARVAVLKQKGGMSYLQAWDVKATLIRMFGFGGFSAEVIESKIERIFTKDEYGGNAKWVVLASATVKLTIHQTGAVYTEAAAASQSGAQVGEVADFAIKTAESDALKRAATYLGTQFGLSLYNAGSTADVVRVILAPGQEWPVPPKAQTPASGATTNFEDTQTPVLATAHAEEPLPEGSDVAAAEVENLENIVHGEDNALPWNGELTDEQRAANQALLERGLKMKQDKEEASQADSTPTE
jgi:hypothetical protein